MPLLTAITETEVGQQLTRLALSDGQETGGDDRLQVRQATSRPTAKFDTIVGYIEDMLVDDGFHKIQSQYLETYWEEFTDSEENKHSYMTIFQEYTSAIEKYIEVYLKNRVENFSMEWLLQELQRRPHLDGEVFDILLTITDFTAFKEMFLEYRLVKEGAVDLSSAIQVTQIAPS